jgi:hypothetical protein
MPHNKGLEDMAECAAVLPQVDGKTFGEDNG